MRHQDGEVAGKQPHVQVNRERRVVSVTQVDQDGPPKTISHEYDFVYDSTCEQKELYEQLGIPLVGMAPRLF